LKNEDLLFLKSIENEDERTKTKRLITPNRFSVSISLLIHLIALLVATFVFIEGKNEIESYVEVDFTDAKHRPKLRRMQTPHTPTIKRAQTNVAQQRQFVRNFGTMADIPFGNADIV